MFQFPPLEIAADALLATPTWLPFDLWFTATALDFIPALWNAWYLLRLKNYFGQYLAIVMVATAFESLVAVMSLWLLWPEQVDVVPAFAIARSIGRSIKAVAVFSLALYLGGFIGHSDRPEDQPPAPPSREV